MPPKKKGKAKPKGKGKKGGKGKAAAKKKEDAVGVDNTAGSIDDLKLKVQEKDQQIESEAKQRNYFQLERDKLYSLYEITKKKYEEAEAEIRNKDREMEELVEKHQVAIKVYQQKIKDLLYGHQQDIARLKTETEQTLNAQQDEFLARETELKKDKRALKLELKEVELSHEDIVKNLRQEHDRNITMLRQQYERQVKELHQKYEKKMKTLRDDLELRRRMEIHEIEERKNAHINELMKKHERAFGEIKNYYNDITHNNLDLIKSLKDEVSEMKKKEAANEKLMFEIAQENKRLSEPLQKALSEVEELRHQLANYEKDKLSLQNAKSRIFMLESQLKSLTWEHEVMEQRFEQIQKERDEVYDKFESTVHEVQQKSGFKEMLLERKLQALNDQLEKKEAQLSEVLQAANLDPAVLGAVYKKLDEILEGKNQTIRDLNYELARVTKSHNDIIRTFESKMEEHGIPTEELGFRPLVSRTTTGPAGLVVG